MNIQTITAYRISQTELRSHLKTTYQKKDFTFPDDDDMYSSEQEVFTVEKRDILTPNERKYRDEVLKSGVCYGSDINSILNDMAAEMEIPTGVYILDWTS